MRHFSATSTCCATALQGLLIGLLFLGGCSFPNITLPEDYHLSQSDSIGFFVQQCGDKDIDQVYPSVLYLDLLTKGYAITNLNMIREFRNGTPRWINHAALLDTLVQKKYLSKLRTVFIVHTKKDSAQVITNFSESFVSGGSIRFEYYMMPVIRSEYVAFDVATRRIVFSRAVTDTCYLYSREAGHVFSEYPWMVAARQVYKTMREIPLCAVEGTDSATHRYPLEIYVDKSYRNQFPDEWLPLLQMRLLFVNDIFRKQFNAEFYISRIFEWNSVFGQSLAESMNGLQRVVPGQSRAIRLGITLDANLKMNWLNRNKIGLAMLLGSEAIITAQPSFPDVTAWNSIEESLTMAHEFGHLLGAGHCRDKASIMYPESGSMSYQFDSISTEIINHTLVDFFQSDGQERARNYMQALSLLRKTSFKNSFEAIEPSCEILARNYFRSVIPDSNLIKKSLCALTPDTALQFGIRGFYAFKSGDLECAARLFTRAVQQQTDFSEAHWYLHKILLKRGKVPEAKEHLKIGRQYGIPRIESEYDGF